MKIFIEDLLPYITKRNFDLMEDHYSFKCKIDKIGHSFEVQILKNGQYIFTTLVFNELNYPIEHIEFYMNESKSEVIEKYKEILEELLIRETRMKIKKNWSGRKVFAELLIDDKWIQYGYPGKQSKGNAST